MMRRKSWCSWCWTYTEHELVFGAKWQRAHYRCDGCKSTTATCFSGCGAMAMSQDLFCAFCRGDFRSWQEAEELTAAEPRAVAWMGQERRPAWQPDEAAKQCLKCSSPFAVTVTRHHCRACGQVVCADCSRRRVDLSRMCPFYTQPVRVCDFCAAAPPE